MKNFDRPYFASSLTRFWGRWHISLSTWFRDYVYIPLGGNRGSRWQTLRNLFVVFTISGLWHGAAWNYVLWGWLHFAYLVPGQFIRRRSLESELQSFRWIGLLKIPIVFSLVTYAWIFFRVPGGENAVEAALAVFDRSVFTKPDCSRIGLLWAVVLFGCEWLQGGRDHPLQIDYLPCVVRWMLYCILLTLCLGYFREDSPFLYFQF
jgi:D-alanyl-lipoteichoic acid acyltransferase DltB (MBOAT superfamily)